MVRKRQLEPTRWDLLVFRYPGDTRINYIKRVVGISNETVRIRHGDLFVRRAGEDDFSIIRKPPQVALSMMIAVDDTRHLASSMVQSGWPQRWQPWAVAGGTLSREPFLRRLGLIWPWVKPSTLLLSMRRPLVRFTCTPEAMESGHRHRRLHLGCICPRYEARRRSPFNSSDWQLTRLTSAALTSTSSPPAR